MILNQKWTVLFDVSHFTITVNIKKKLEMGHHRCDDSDDDDDDGDSDSDFKCEICPLEQGYRKDTQHFCLPHCLVYKLRHIKERFWLVACKWLACHLFYISPL